MSHTSLSFQDGDNLDELCLEAISESLPSADATDRELAVVAEQGLAGLPETDRARVASAIAADTNGASAAAILFQMNRAIGSSVAADVSSHVAQPAVAPINPSQRDKVIKAKMPLIYRLSMPVWGIAASVGLVMGISLLLAQRTGPSFVAKSQPSAEVQSARISHDSEHSSASSSSIAVLVTVTVVFVALSPLVYRRVRWRAN
jgi:cobalamin biosynthesis Mg chelatase CobN